MKRYKLPIMNAKQYFEELKIKYKLNVSFTVYKKLIKIKAKNDTINYIKWYIDNIIFSDYYYAKYNVILMHLCFRTTSIPFNRIHVIKNDEVKEVQRHPVYTRFVLTPTNIYLFQANKENITNIYNKIVPKNLNAIQITPYYLYCKDTLNCDLRLSI